MWLSESNVFESVVPSAGHVLVLTSDTRTQVQILLRAQTQSELQCLFPPGIHKVYPHELAGLLTFIHWVLFTSQGENRKFVLRFQGLMFSLL